MLKMTKVLLFILVSMVVENTAFLTSLTTSPAKNNPVLLKLLQTVDAATTDERLLDVSLQLLKSLCVCMRETLKSKQSESLSFSGDTNSLQVDDVRDPNKKVLNLYQNIYNKTCFDLKNELALKVNKSAKLSTDEEKDFILKSDCGKRPVHGITKSYERDHQLTKADQNVVKLEDILYQTFVKTRNYHTFRTRKYGLYKKMGNRRNENVPVKHSIIVILTLYPAYNKSLFLKNCSKLTDELNNTLYTHSPIDIDIIDTRYRQKENDSEEDLNAREATNCSLKSIYTFLLQSEKNNKTKIFKLIQRQNTVKVYLDVVAEPNHTDYTETCCNNGTEVPMCKIDISNASFESKEITTYPSTFETATSKQMNFKKTIDSIKTLVKLYDKKIKKKKLKRSTIQPSAIDNAVNSELRKDNLKNTNIDKIVSYTEKVVNKKYKSNFTFFKPIKQVKEYTRNSLITKLGSQYLINDTYSKELWMNNILDSKLNYESYQTNTITSKLQTSWRDHQGIITSTIPNLKSDQILMITPKNSDSSTKRITPIRNAVDTKQITDVAYLYMQNNSYYKSTEPYLELQMSHVDSVTAKHITNLESINKSRLVTLPIQKNKQKFVSENNINNLKLAYEDNSPIEIPIEFIITTNKNKHKNENKNNLLTKSTNKITIKNLPKNSERSPVDIINQYSENDNHETALARNFSTKTTFFNIFNIFFTDRAKTTHERTISPTNYNHHKIIEDESNLGTSNIISKVSNGYDEKLVMDQPVYSTTTTKVYEHQITPQQTYTHNSFISETSPYNNNTFKLPLNTNKSKHGSYYDKILNKSTLTTPSTHKNAKSILFSLNEKSNVMTEKTLKMMYSNSTTFFYGSNVNAKKTNNNLVLDLSMTTVFNSMSNNETDNDIKLKIFDTATHVTNKTIDISGPKLNVSATTFNELIKSDTLFSNHTHAAHNSTTRPNIKKLQNSITSVNPVSYFQTTSQNNNNIFDNNVLGGTSKSNTQDDSLVKPRLFKTNEINKPMKDAYYTYNTVFQVNLNSKIKPSFIVTKPNSFGDHRDMTTYYTAPILHITEKITDKIKDNLLSTSPPVLTGSIDELEKYKVNKKEMKSNIISSNKNDMKHPYTTTIDNISNIQKDFTVTNSISSTQTYTKSKKSEKWDSHLEKHEKTLTSMNTGFNVNTSTDTKLDTISKTPLITYVTKSLATLRIIPTTSLNPQTKDFNSRIKNKLNYTTTTDPEIKQVGVSTLMKRPFIGSVLNNNTDRKTEKSYTTIEALNITEKRYLLEEYVQKPAGLKNDFVNTEYIETENDTVIIITPLNTASQPINVNRSRVLEPTTLTVSYASTVKVTNNRFETTVKPNYIKDSQEKTSNTQLETTNNSTNSEKKTFASGISKEPALFTNNIQKSTYKLINIDTNEIPVATVTPIDSQYSRMSTETMSFKDGIDNLQRNGSTLVTGDIDELQKLKSIERTIKLDSIPSNENESTETKIPDTIVPIRNISLKNLSTTTIGNYSGFQGNNAVTTSINRNNDTNLAQENFVINTSTSHIVIKKEKKEWQSNLENDDNQPLMNTAIKYNKKVSPNTAKENTSKAPMTATMTQNETNSSTQFRNIPTNSQTQTDTNNYHKEIKQNYTAATNPVIKSGNVTAVTDVSAVTEYPFIKSGIGNDKDRLTENPYTIVEAVAVTETPLLLNEYVKIPTGQIIGRLEEYVKTEKYTVVNFTPLHISKEQTKFNESRVIMPSNLIVSNSDTVKVTTSNNFETTAKPNYITAINVEASSLPLDKIYKTPIITYVTNSDPNSLIKLQNIPTRYISQNQQTENKNYRIENQQNYTATIDPEIKASSEKVVTDISASSKYYIIDSVLGNDNDDQMEKPYTISDSVTITETPFLLNKYVKTPTGLIKERLKEYVKTEPYTVVKFTPLNTENQQTEFKESKNLMPSKLTLSNAETVKITSNYFETTVEPNYTTAVNVGASPNIAIEKTFKTPMITYVTQSETKNSTHLRNKPTTSQNQRPEDNNFHKEIKRNYTAAMDQEMKNGIGKAVTGVSAGTTYPFMESVPGDDKNFATEKPYKTIKAVSITEIPLLLNEYVEMPTDQTSEYLKEHVKTKNNTMINLTPLSTSNQQTEFYKLKVLEATKLIASNADTSKVTSNSFETTMEYNYTKQSQEKASNIQLEATDTANSEKIHFANGLSEEKGLFANYLRQTTYKLENTASHETPFTTITPIDAQYSRMWTANMSVNDDIDNFQSTGPIVVTRGLDELREPKSDGPIKSENSFSNENGSIETKKVNTKVTINDADLNHTSFTINDIFSIFQINNDVTISTLRNDAIKLPRHDSVTNTSTTTIQKENDESYSHLENQHETLNHMNTGVNIKSSPNTTVVNTFEPPIITNTTESKTNSLTPLHNSQTTISNQQLDDNSRIENRQYYTAATNLSTVMEYPFFGLSNDKDSQTEKQHKTIEVVTITETPLLLAEYVEMPKKYLETENYTVVNFTPFNTVAQQTNANISKVLEPTKLILNNEKKVTSNYSGTTVELNYTKQRQEKVSNIQLETTKDTASSEEIAFASGFSKETAFINSYLQKTTNKLETIELNKMSITTNSPIDSEYSRMWTATISNDIIVKKSGIYNKNTKNKTLKREDYPETVDNSIIIDENITLTTASTNILNASKVLCKTNKFVETNDIINNTSKYNSTTIKFTGELYDNTSKEKKALSIDTVAKESPFTSSIPINKENTERKVSVVETVKLIGRNVLSPQNKTNIPLVMTTDNIKQMFARDGTHNIVNKNDVKILNTLKYADPNTINKNQKYFSHKYNDLTISNMINNIKNNTENETKSILITETTVNVMKSIFFGDFTLNSYFTKNMSDRTRPHNENEPNITDLFRDSKFDVDKTESNTIAILTNAQAWNYSTVFDSKLKLTTDIGSQFNTNLKFAVNNTKQPKLLYDFGINSKVNALSENITHTTISNLPNQIEGTAIVFIADTSYGINKTCSTNVKESVNTSVINSYQTSFTNSEDINYNQHDLCGYISTTTSYFGHNIEVKSDDMLSQDMKLNVPVTNKGNNWITSFNKTVVPNDLNNTEKPTFMEATNMSYELHDSTQNGFLVTKPHAQVDNQNMTNIIEFSETAHKLEINTSTTSRSPPTPINSVVIGKFKKVTKYTKHDTVNHSTPEIMKKNQAFTYNISNIDRNQTEMTNIIHANNGLVPVSAFSKDGEMIKAVTSTSNISKATSNTTRPWLEHYLFKYTSKPMMTSEASGNNDSLVFHPLSTVAEVISYDVNDKFNDTDSINRITELPDTFQTLFIKGLFGNEQQNPNFVTSVTPNIAITSNYSNVKGIFSKIREFNKLSTIYSNESQSWATKDPFKNVNQDIQLYQQNPNIYYADNVDLQVTTDELNILKINNVSTKATNLARVDNDESVSSVISKIKEMILNDAKIKEPSKLPYLLAGSQTQNISEKIIPRLQNNSKFELKTISKIPSETTNTNETSTKSLKIILDMINNKNKSQEENSTQGCKQNMNTSEINYKEGNSVSTALIQNESNKHYLSNTKTTTSQRNVTETPSAQTLQQTDPLTNYLYLEHEQIVNYTSKKNMPYNNINEPYVNIKLETTNVPEINALNTDGKTYGVNSKLEHSQLTTSSSKAGDSISRLVTPSSQFNSTKIDLNFVLQKDIKPYKMVHTKSLITNQGKTSQSFEKTVTDGLFQPQFVNPNDYLNTVMIMSPSKAVNFLSQEPWSKFTMPEKSLDSSNSELQIATKTDSPLLNTVIIDGSINNGFKLLETTGIGFMKTSNIKEKDVEPNSVTFNVISDVNTNIITMNSNNNIPIPFNSKSFPLTLYPVNKNKVQHKVTGSNTVIENGYMLQPEHLKSEKNTSTTQMFHAQSVFDHNPNDTTEYKEYYTTVASITRVLNDYVSTTNDNINDSNTDHNLIESDKITSRSGNKSSVMSSIDTISNDTYTVLHKGIPNIVLRNFTGTSDHRDNLFSSSFPNIGVMTSEKSSVTIPKVINEISNSKNTKFVTSNSELNIITKTPLLNTINTPNNIHKGIEVLETTGINLVKTSAKLKKKEQSIGSGNINVKTLNEKDINSKITIGNNNILLPINTKLLQPKQYQLNKDNIQHGATVTLQDIRAVLENNYLVQEKQHYNKIQFVKPFLQPEIVLSIAKVTSTQKNVLDRDNNNIPESKESITTLGSSTRLANNFASTYSSIYDSNIRLNYNKLKNTIREKGIESATSANTNASISVNTNKVSNFLRDSEGKGENFINFTLSSLPNITRVLTPEIFSLTMPKTTKKIPYPKSKQPQIISLINSTNVTDTYSKSTTPRFELINDFHISGSNLASTIYKENAGNVSIQINDTGIIKEKNFNHTTYSNKFKSFEMKPSKINITKSRRFQVTLNEIDTSGNKIKTANNFENDTKATVTKSLFYDDKLTKRQHTIRQSIQEIKRNNRFIINSKGTVMPNILNKNVSVSAVPVILEQKYVNFIRDYSNKIVAAKSGSIGKRRKFNDSYYKKTIFVLKTTTNQSLLTRKSKLVEDTKLSMFRNNMTTESINISDHFNSITDYKKSLVHFNTFSNRTIHFIDKPIYFHGDVIEPKYFESLEKRKYKRTRKTAVSKKNITSKPVLKTTKAIIYNTYKPLTEDELTLPPDIKKIVTTYTTILTKKANTSNEHLKIKARKSKVQHIKLTVKPKLPLTTTKKKKNEIKKVNRINKKESNDTNLHDPPFSFFKKTYLHPIENLPVESRRKSLERIKLNNRKNKILLMNTEDFLSIRRAVTRRHELREFHQPPMPRHMMKIPKVMTIQPRRMILRPKFNSFEDFKKYPSVSPVISKPLMIDDNDFYRSSYQTHHRPRQIWKDKIDQVRTKLEPQRRSNNRQRINFVPVADVPYYMPVAMKPHFVRDKVESVRSYIFNEEMNQGNGRRHFMNAPRVETSGVSVDSPDSQDRVYYSAGTSRQVTEMPVPRVNDFWLDDMYMKVRLPLPINSNPGMVFPRRRFAKVDEVADLAALFIDDLLDYKEMLDRGELPLERATSREKGQPLCMEQFYRLLGVCRIPEVGRDRLELPPLRPEGEQEELVVVACRNYFYPIPVKAADRGRLTPGEIQAQLLMAMVESASAPAAPRVGLLSALPRDAWARARDILSNDETNRHNMELISRALCVVCLDEGGGDRADADADTNALLRAMHGAGTRHHSANRWFDKTVQLIISSDGTVGMCYEHSAAEGVAVVRLAERALARAAVADRPSPPPALLPAPQAMRWTVPPEVDRMIDLAGKEIDRNIADLDLKVYTYRGYGREYMKSCRTSPDVYIQLAMQYAYYKMYGNLVSTYESASLRRFLQGRVDNIRSAHVPAQAWAKAMCADETPPLSDADDSQKKEQKKLELFEEAAKKQTAIMEANILGRGIDNHLLALREIARGLGPLPELFTDPTYKLMNEFRLSTSQVATTTDGTFMGYGAVIPDGYGCSYNPKKDCVIFCIASFTSSSVTNTEAFRQSLEEALDSMKLMFQHRQTE